MTKTVRNTRSRNPRAYALSVAGGVLVLLGVAVWNSLLVVAVGAGLAVAGWLVARRTR
ncbi:hypothetical protein M8C17_28685 [Micromonospora sp. RHAY321]|uniref:hypothetical protein n=1 Tax=Micromonospora sp. RHAY321 TaxID=2944807 RepID=UPI00207D177E|nr:hypothetical protein [Micromonospora sp. RHAY321]MCO1599139.1 hypothetical protein [Micromonospora sp. RHAY321]